MLDPRYLKRILESLAHQFSDFTKHITVEVGDDFFLLSSNQLQTPSNIEKYLNTNLEEVHQLRVMVDGLNKLVELINIGRVPYQYYNFITQHSNHPLVALVALVCVDSVYVDNTRLEKYPGLKKANALHNYLLANYRLPSIDKLPTPLEQALVGLLHLSLVGYVRGIDKVNQQVVNTLLECKNLLTKAKSEANNEKRERIAKKIIDLIIRLPGTESSELCETLPLIVPPKVKQLVTNIINTNKFFNQNTETKTSDTQTTSSPSNIPEELQPSTENFEDWCGTSFKSKDVMQELQEISETEKDLLEMIEEQLFQLKLEEEQIEKFGDPKERDRLVNWHYKIQLPTHIEQELYYLLYQLKTKQKYVESNVGRFINIKNYIRYVSGDVNIQDRLFYDVEIKDVGNRAVLLVIDQSGSMQGKKLELVRLAAHILATAVSELGDNLAIFGFRGGSNDSCEIIPVLFWGEKYREEYLSILYAVGSTPLREALIKAREWINGVMAHEKLVIVLTDGEPTTSTTQEVREVVEKMKSEGVVVIGVGIGLKIKPKQLKECFGEGGYVWVPDLEELPRELFRVYLQQYGVVI